MAVEAQQPLVEQAREQLADGKSIQALAIARRAAQEDPDDYKAHYYIAFALMELGEATDAAKAAERSSQLARTPEAKAAVATLQASLSAQTGLKEADSAAAEGLHAKAGRLYLQAWEKGVLPPDKALIAADLFEKQLKDGVTAARILRDMPGRYAGTPIADEASKRLVGLRPALKQAANEALSQATKLEPGDPNRVKWLKLVIDADADNQVAQQMLANDAAEGQDWAALELQLKLLQRKAMLGPLLERSDLSLGKWQTDARLRTLLSDIWGDKRGAELLAMNKADSQPLSIDAASTRAARKLAKITTEFESAGLKAGTGVAFRDCADCPEVVWIPPGSMPQLPGDQVFRKWLNSVVIGYPMAVGKYEVTFDEWDTCTAAGACRAVDEGFSEGVIFNTKWGRGRQPVVNVTRADIQSYLQWLSKKTGQNYRGLSMSEYVYAARAGRTGTDLIANSARCFGCNSTVILNPAVVGSYQGNGWGLYDMIGNVDEFVSDCYSDDKSAATFPIDGQPVRTRCVRDANGVRMLRMGGNWATSAAIAGDDDLRQVDSEVSSSKFSGFRVVRTFAEK